MNDGRLRWFEHVKKRQTIEPVRVVETLTLGGGGGGVEADSNLVKKNILGKIY
ncbi:hypothetical protein HanIR_Chr13g0644941 [Helianthus annuus]|nr:hypothetical protein HanIR_Chr13g0644941 [Helianthus annuus]